MLLAAQACALLVVDLQARLVPVLEAPEDLISRCRIVLQAAARLDVPVLATEQYPKGLGHLVLPIRSLIAPERVVPKIAFSAMRDPEPAERISQLGRDTIVVIGAEAHVCVLQTVIDLLARGRKVAVVADGVGTRRALDKEVGLGRMARAGAQIVTTDMVVFEWMERAGTEIFRELIPLLR
ncbi:MAG TPA: isochorismatase family protein [Geminicoccus sp.]|uniref:isochorismatase family protein n=1 Tax=Geminicoccus sp. TaxID=2024832 RepID=UPI002E3747A4|nr:isochorismatase family protein [Geminicoccus sp.]HEX2529531.1 isochorismatase family protein [Geminicoccus sp.]